ncbi:MAG: hypothetical protein KF716_10065 [Anaerolineae bacterium]|nr:hypothetical protein [Anaerolineae bacterium]
MSNVMDLWPTDIDASNEFDVPPVALLREQAELLGKRTDNKVVGKVMSVQVKHTFSHRFVGDYGQKLEQALGYSFLITAPELNYQYALFVIAVSIDSYPVRFELDYGLTKEAWANGNPTIEAASEDEFIDILKNIFNAQKTRRIISSLLAQFDEESKS